ncbi:MAG: MerR family transcriptional regulator [Bermanella sp.]
MYIGEAAKITGLSIKAIRFYEEKELIKAPKREGRYRVYNQTDLELLVLIREARELDISLAQLQGIIVYKNGEVDWARIKAFLDDIKAKLRAQIAEIEQKIINIDVCYQQIKA